MRTLITLSLVLLSLPLLAQNSLIDQGRAAMARNDADAAAAVLEKAVAQNPKSAEAHYLLGSAYGSQAQKASMFSQASLASKTRDEFEQAVALDPNLIDARFGLVQFYTLAPGIMGGSYDKASAQVVEIRKRDPLMAHRAAAFIHSNQKKLDLARKEYFDEVRELPQSPRAHLDLGAFELAQKNYSAARDEFDAALKLDPTYMPGYFRVGQLAALSGTAYPRGEESLRKYLSYSPKPGEPSIARAHYWLGQIFEKQGRKAEARASFSASLKMSPGQKDVAEALKRVS